jgi:hypothetical protein
MASRDKTPLSGVVETDETILGGRDERSKGRKLGPNKALVVISVEDDNGRCGRVRLRAVDTASGENLARVVSQTVAKGATLRTDGWQAYQAVPGVTHRPQVIGDSKRASTVLPLVHRVASLLKRYVKGILHGSWRPNWLGWMLEDWEYRFNRRKAARRPLLFERLVQWGAELRVPTRKDWHDYTLATSRL